MECAQPRPATGVESDTITITLDDFNRRRAEHPRRINPTMPAVMPEMMCYRDGTYVEKDKRGRKAKDGGKGRGE